MPATPVSADGYAFAPVAVEPKAPVGPRSPVPGVTVAAVLIAMGVLALLNRLTDWTPGPRVFLGTALLMVGLGLGVAAFVGGRSGQGWPHRAGRRPVARPAVRVDRPVARNARRLR